MKYKVITDEGKEMYVEGVVAVTSPDRNNEIFSKEAIESLREQLIDKTIDSFPKVENKSANWRVKKE